MMDDKLKVFWNLDVLVKMCRSKSDGPSLRIEEEEIVEKIETCKLEIEEIKSQSDEESYDTSAEMADRNIEIITKKQLQTLKNTLKEKNKELNALKEEEKNLYSSNSLLRENKISQEKYIFSMQERINEATDYEVIDRYNGLIAETTEKISILVDALEEDNETYEKVQQEILVLSEEISNIEDNIDKKKKLLAETQANLENRDNYIDKSKKEKTDKKIAELELKVQKATSRLEEIRKDPKYLESKIKDIINDREDIEKAKPYLVSLINTVIKVPYINVPADNALEEELLKATQARDSFANDIEQKSYNILETNTPEKVRIEFLNERISLWTKELEELKVKVDTIDRDQEYKYEEKHQTLQNMIQSMKKDLREYEKAYAQAPDISVGAKASIKAAMDEKRTDLIEAEKIVTAFRKDESNDIARATRTIKYECERLNQNIQNAENEIETIKNRLTSKKSGLIDIGAKNKDKDTLKELAQTVIDIKHRRQFPETPLEIVKRLETELDLRLLNDIDGTQIENTSNIVKKDYNEFEESKKEVRRGIKVIEETEVETNIEEDEGAAQAKIEEAEAELQSLINNIEENEKETTSQKVEETQSVEEENETVGVEEVNAVVEENDLDVEVPTEEETKEEIETTSNDETPTIEEKEEEIETPAVEESSPIIDEIETAVEEPVAEEISVPEETEIETEIPVIEEQTPVIEETTIEAPIVEETPVVEANEMEVETPVIEEVIPVVEETEVEIEAPIVTEVPVVEETTIEAPIVEEAPVVEANEMEVENPVVEEVVPVVDETKVEIEAPIVTEVPVVEETAIEEPIIEEPTPVVEEPIQTIEQPVIEMEPIVQEPVVEETQLISENEEDTMLDQQIDNIMSSAHDEQNDENQPLDIDAMFASPTEVVAQSEPVNPKLSIDTIFNVETDKIDGEDTSNEHLVDDFNQYINDLGNKEA